MILSDIINIIETEFPKDLQESYDNCGLQVGNQNSEIAAAFICFDVTVDMVQEAISNKCNLIISHHPLIFHKLKNIDANTTIGKIINIAIKNDIAIYSLHTSFDKHYGGVSYSLAKQLNLKNIEILSPISNSLRKLVTFCPTLQSEALRQSLFVAGAGHIGNYSSCSFNAEGKGSFKASESCNPFVGKIDSLHYEPETRIETIFPIWKQNKIIKTLLANHPYEEVAYDIYPLENTFNKYGLGCIGTLDNYLSKDDFLSYVKNNLNVKVLKFNNAFDGKIKKIALCGGSGEELISEAMNNNAEAYITADCKYHSFQRADNKILLVDAGHYETEIFSLKTLMCLLSEKIPNFAILISKTNTNFVSYY